MPDPTIAVTFHEAVTEEYRRAVATHGNSGAAVNKLDMFAHAAEAIQMRIHSGEIEIPVEDAIHAALSAADQRDGATADNILAQVARGELGLDLWPDPRLDIVVVLGAGRRKAWKHVTADDLSDMAELRNRNTKAAQRSERRFLADVKTVYADLVTAGSIGALVEANRAAVGAA
jgi:hypothetical protein